MNPFAVNLGLALAWAILFDSVTLGTLAVGFIVGAIVLWFVRPAFSDQRYSGRLFDILFLFLAFVWELLVSSLQVAWAVLSPNPTFRAGVIAFPLSAETDLEITLVANLVSLTPGSLTLDVSDDRRELAVHAMFIDDPDQYCASVRNGLERRALAALR